MMEGSEQRDDGIVPDKLLMLKYKYVNRVRAPISDGILPVNLLVWKDKIVN